LKNVKYVCHIEKQILQNDMKEILMIFYFLLYFALGFWLIKPKIFNYDVLKMEIRLLPRFFKWIGLATIIINVVVSFFIPSPHEIVKELFLYHLNFSFLLIAFSKDLTEDEFISHLRMKSIMVSFISVLIGFSATYVAYPFYTLKGNTWFEDFSAPLFISAFWICHLFYFYFAKFRLRKE